MARSTALALCAINWVRSILGHEPANAATNREAVIVRCLACLRPDQVITAAHLFETVRSSSPFTFRSISFARFEEELFQLKAEHRITNDHLGHWRLSRQVEQLQRTRVNCPQNEIQNSSICRTRN